MLLRKQYPRKRPLLDLACNNEALAKLLWNLSLYLVLPSSDECILPIHHVSDTAGAPIRSTPSIFTASSGELVEFIRLGAQWHAVVLDDKTRMVPQQTLPVRSGDKDIDRLVTQLLLSG
jgi:hypothetical protein